MPPMISLGPFAGTALRSSAITASANSPSGDRNLPLTMSLARIASMMASYSAPVGQLVGHDRRRVAGGVRLAARRQHGDEAVDAVGQLQIDDGAAEGLELRLLQEVLALDHHQHVVLAGGEAAIDLLVAAELLGIGAEELGERVVDPQPQQPQPARADTSRTNAMVTTGALSPIRPSRSSPNANDRRGASTLASITPPKSRSLRRFWLAW